MGQSNGPVDARKVDGKVGRFESEDALLVCGILAALLYLIADIAGGLSWPGYSFAAQTISELSAIGAPSRPVVVAIFTIDNILLIAFAAGIWRAAGDVIALRITATALLLIALAGLVASAFGSMHVRGDQPMESGDVLHIVLTIFTVGSIFIGVTASAAALGPRFRLYAIATVAVMFVFGALAALDGPRIAQNLPTPFVGVTERINVYAYNLWLGVMSFALLFRRRAA